jgi:hypothetical protein
LPSGPLASIQLTLLPLEPFASAVTIVNLRDSLKRPVTRAGLPEVWSSSDTTIAMVADGVVTGHLPGDAVITATIGGMSASTVAHIAWRPETQLRIAQAAITASVGDRIVFTPRATTPLSAGDLQWTSSNASVARLDGPGIFAAVEPGTATVVGRVAGLVDSVRVHVVHGELGFGYFYSSDAVAGDDYEDYGYTPWSPRAENGYSTAGGVNATWQPPYASLPNLGWIGPSVPVPDVILHVVSLESMACTAYLQVDDGFTFVAPGAPLVECRDRAGTPGVQSVQMEFVAFRRGEFSGTVAVARPDGATFMADSGTMSQAFAAPNTRGYSVTGVSRDSLFWFVTPGAANLTTCATVPLRDLPAQFAVSVICAGVKGLSADARSYLVGFGPDARHGSAPIGFIELGDHGVITRKTVSGLDISASGTSLGALDLTVRGEQLAAFDRFPAVLVTAIGSSADACSLREGARTQTTAQFRLTCPAGIAGATIGVIY